MIFLLDYDRPAGKLVSFRVFEGKDRRIAERRRLELEISHSEAGLLDREVVLLEAENEAIIRQTHRRYFEDLSELARTPGQQPALNVQKL